jgi:tetratricopeptide (TPR) repeat protein
VRNRTRAPWRRVWMLLAFLLTLVACGRDGIEAHLDRGEEALGNGEWDEAHLEGIYVLQEQPGNREALWLVGRSLLALNRDGEAEGYLRGLVERDSSKRVPAANLYAERARDDYQAGRHNRAANRWQRSLEFEPNLDLGPFAFFIAGRFFKLEDYENAIVLFERAEEAYPDSSAVEEILYPKALSLIRLGRWEEAREQLARFLKKAPKHPRRQEAIFLFQDVLIRLGRADRESLDFEAALEKLNRALRYRINPGKIEEARLEKGRCLEDLGRYREAAEVYRRLVDENSSGSGRIFEAALERLERIEKARLK